MKLSLGFSPCPNDTFIFDALVNHKIDTEGIEFDVQLEDVQTLNRWAMENKLDVSKISYGVLPLLLKHYLVLNSGGALGKGVGPLLIARKEETGAAPSFNPVKMTVAIPGENTTAHMLFTVAYPEVQKKQFLLFSEIEQAVINGTVDAGVIIHENRFTYMEKGLVKIMDLGEFWERETQSPIPLGGIISRRSLDKNLSSTLDKLIKRSVEFAFQNYPEITDYVKQHAQEMQESVMRLHIDLYVNNYSIELKEEGKAAVRKLLKVYQDMHQLQIPQDNIFVDEIPVTV